VGKPVAGEVVIIPFPQTNLAVGKRRPALVLVDLPGDDLILCQITTRADRISPPLRWTPPSSSVGNWRNQVEVLWRDIRESRIAA